MMNVTQLKAAIRRGDLDAVYKECRRYGTITDRIEQDYRGDLLTTVIIMHEGIHFEFDLVRGEVIHMGAVE